MRVLYFTLGYTPHDYRFLSSLVEAGQEVYSMRLENAQASRQLEDRPLPSQVEQVSWRGGKGSFHWRDTLALAADLRRAVAKIRPDVVHAGPIPQVAFLAALAGCRPLVSMSWGSDLLEQVEHNRWLNWTARYALQHSAVLVGDCQAVRRKAETMGFPLQRIVLFPWGVDLQQFTPGKEEGWRARQGWEDAFVLLSMRSWEPLYGVDVIAQAFGQAAQQVPDLRLLLVGNGSQAARIRQVLMQHGVMEQVFWAGQVKYNDLPHFYHSADLYLSASHSDGSSVSLLEAMACGLPVLVSDIAGNREWLEGSGAGWLFPDGRADLLAEEIVRLASRGNPSNACRGNPSNGCRVNVLAQAGQKGRILAENRADWSKNFQELLRAYHLAVEKEQA